MSVSVNAHQIGSQKWYRQQQPPVFELNAEKIKIIDLFCGIGGLSLGAAEACHFLAYRPEISMAIDSSQDAINIFKANFLSISANIQCNDISKIFKSSIFSEINNLENSIIKKIDKCHILIAGPPCQGHSDLNNRTRRIDDRNLLYLRAIRAAVLLKPELVIIENVPAALNDHHQSIQKSAAALTKQGYTTELLNADLSKFGIAQSRRRLFLIGHHFTPGTFNEMYKQISIPIKTLKDTIKDLKIIDSSLFDSPSKSSPENKRRMKFMFDNNLFDLPNCHRPACHRDKKHSYTSMYGRLDWERPAQTITSGFGSPGQGRYIHPKEQRTLTPHEAARIQGFPDYFRFSEISFRSVLQTLIGNAVPPAASFHLVEHFLRLRRAHGQNACTNTKSSE